MPESMRIVRNSDNETLMPWGEEVLINGFVKEVNCRDAAEARAWILVPSRQRLLEFVRYWANVELDLKWVFFIGGFCCGDFPREAFAASCLNRIRDLLGDKEVEDIFDSVYAEGGKDVDPKIWDIFLHGDMAQWSAVQEEICRVPQNNWDCRARAQGIEPPSQDDPTGL